MKNFAPDEHQLHPMSLMAFALSLVSLIIVVVSMIAARYTDSFHWLIILDTFICLIFWFQLSIDLVRSRNKRRYLRQHWIDFIASVPIIEPLRFMRLFQIFRVIRLIRTSQDVLGQLSRAPKETTLASLILLLTLLLTLGSTFILLVEGNAPDATITNADDALWWVIVTISTVGYGDLYPVTNWGRIIAGIVIVSGVAIFGMVAGLVSSAIQKRHQVQPEWQQILDNQERLLKRIDSLEQQLKSEKESSVSYRKP
ncbi:potassium channel family protein [Thaumasiovibrio subtropicus]|uniref:potassium channel family protein n=1 Tax=Thaumasiovibrio subtropicus TaxID=1891207 RepID=UPI000B357877|nr:potassium channel family protein [Thaumasiovibrio subtropicus]